MEINQGGEILNFRLVRLHKKAEWVVFIHGAGGSIKTWDYQVDEFKKYFNLLLLDLRDHGASKNIYPNEKNYSFELISQDIKQVMDRLKIEKAHFVTLSFGSVIIQDFTLRFSGVVDRIAIGGGIFKGNLPIRMFVSAARMMNLIFAYPTMYRIFSYLLMPRKRHQLARRMYQMQARKLTSIEYLKWVGLYGEFFRLLKQFFKHNIEKPTLIIMGSDDFIFLKGARQFLKHQSNARLINLPGVGHICNIESPATFNRHAIEFLQSKEL